MRTHEKGMGQSNLARISLLVEMQIATPTGRDAHLDEMRRSKEDSRGDGSYETECDDLEKAPSVPPKNSLASLVGGNDVVATKMRK